MQPKLTILAFGFLSFGLLAGNSHIPSLRAQAPANPAAFVPVQNAAPAPAAPATPPSAQENDGDDDPVADTGTGALPTQIHFERVGRAAGALRRTCDLTVFRGALYQAHANQPLGSDGATITRYRPDEPRVFSTAFDWNRPGQPTRGGGGGQGFLRVHSIDGRLFVPDADPPYNGFGFVDGGTEGFVFLSDREGNFAPARGSRLLAPGVPSAEGRAGASILPRAYHVIDTIRFRGRYYASTGSVPPRERAWVGPSPGALHVANATFSRFLYEVDYPFPYQNGVWRLTYMVRFRGRLYAGIQDYWGREPNDYVVMNPPAASTAIRREDVRAVRVSSTGAALTLRWYADAGKLYWIALGQRGVVTLRVTEDGERWREIALPAEGGRPTDVTRFRGNVVVLTERALYRLDGERPVLLGVSSAARAPFAVTDAFCAAPLAVFRNELYAGGQWDGALFRVVEGPEPPNTQESGRGNRRPQR